MEVSLYNARKTALQPPAIAYLRGVHARMIEASHLHNGSAQPLSKKDAARKIHDIIRNASVFLKESMNVSLGIPASYDFCGQAAVPIESERELQDARRWLNASATLSFFNIDRSLWIPSNNSEWWNSSIHCAPKARATSRKNDEGRAGIRSRNSLLEGGMETAESIPSE